MKRRWRNIAVWVAATTASVMAGVNVRPSRAGAAIQPTDPAPAALPSPADAARQQLQEAAAVLSDPAASAAQHDQAARRLLAIGSDDSKRLLLQALSQPNPASQQAVARAISDEVDADPAFIEPLFNLLSDPSSNKSMTDDTATGLSTYRSNPNVLSRLMELAATPRPAREHVRISAIHAIGAFTEKRAASTLVSLIRDPEQSPQIHGAAADALANMTGIGNLGSDSQLWERWWTANRGKSDAEFHQSLVERKANLFDHERARTARLTQLLQSLAKERYLASGATEREAIMLRYLRASEPELRAAGAQQVDDDLINARTVPQAVRDHLRTMISDNNPEVRLRVATALRHANDAGSVEALLAQLSRESDPTVRAAIAQALGPMRDIRAAPELIKLLNGDDKLAARAAATSLAVLFKDLGDDVLKQHPDLTKTASNDLVQVIERTAKSPGDTDLRVACIQALVPLQRPELVNLWIRLIRREEAPEVRRYAMLALGSTGDPQTADAILDSIRRDPNDTVVVEAIKALGNVSPSHAQLQNLKPFLAPDNRRDQSLRDAAWTVLQSTLPSLTPLQLNDWAGSLEGDPGKQVIVLRTLADLQMKDKDLDNFAATQEQIADNYVEMGDPEGALAYFKGALDYRLGPGAGAGGPGLEALIDRYMKALLRSGRYADAVAFATQRIASSPGLQRNMGSAMYNEAGRLAEKDVVENLQKSKELINQVKKMDPPLDDKYLGPLLKLSEQIDKRLADLTRPPGTGPRSASIPFIPFFERGLTVTV